jgi:hypothetical protein
MNLVLVDVVALRGKGGAPDGSLKRDDFQVFDNGRPVRMKTFDAGAGTRPLAFWFVVQCKMPGWEAEDSGLFAGQIHLLEPGLKKLDQQDRVAVAHWCDNGDSALDLLPTNGIGKSAIALEQVLATNPSGEYKHDRTGELALQKMLQQIVDATRSLPRDTVPVVIFLYGDFSAMPKGEADQLVDKLLETSAAVYGLKDQRSPKIMGLNWLGGETEAIANYISTQTGGQYLRLTPDTYASGLGEILEQLHFRYELGFQPEMMGGKRHKLNVKLTGAGKSQHRGLRLRYRTAYVPVRN